MIIRQCTMIGLTSYLKENNSEGLVFLDTMHHNLDCEDKLNISEALCNIPDFCYFIIDGNREACSLAEYIYRDWTNFNIPGRTTLGILDCVNRVGNPHTHLLRYAHSYIYLHGWNNLEIVKDRFGNLKSNILNNIIESEAMRIELIK